MVLVGAGVDHGEFKALAEEHLGALPASAASSSSSSPPPPGGVLTAAQRGGIGSYVGGEHVDTTSKLAVKDEFAHVALSWMSSWEVT